MYGETLSVQWFLRKLKSRCGNRITVSYSGQDFSIFTWYYMFICIFVGTSGKTGNKIDWFKYPIAPKIRNIMVISANVLSRLVFIDKNKNGRSWGFAIKNFIKGVRFAIIICGTKRRQTKKTRTALKWKTMLIVTFIHLSAGIYLKIE